MSKPGESAAERIWKEKLDHCLSRSECSVLLVFAVSVLIVTWLIGW